jgi:hypothetical protein
LPVDRDKAISRSPELLKYLHPQYSAHTTQGDTEKSDNFIEDKRTAMRFLLSRSMALNKVDRLIGVNYA